MPRDRVHACTLQAESVHVVVHAFSRLHVRAISRPLTVVTLQKSSNQVAPPPPAGYALRKLAVSCGIWRRISENPCQKKMERMGSLYQLGGLIFATETGTIINPSNLRNRSFKPLLERAQLRPIRFHDLRHTCATLLLSKDVNAKIVSEMLGHFSISVTMDIYSHLLPDMQEKGARALEEVMS